MRINAFVATLLTVIITLLLWSPVPVHAQSTFPNFAKTSLLTFRWTAGTINNGGHAVTIAASSGGVATASQANCAAPAYSACNFVYSNAAGTVATTTTLTTALATGNTVLALIETDGTGITRIVQGNQISTTGTIGPFVQATSCVASLTCAAPLNTSGNLKMAYGTGALSSGTPSQATVSAIAPAFVSTAKMYCTATTVGSTAVIAAAGLAINLVSSSSFTVTGPNTVTTSFFWICVGE